MEEDSNCLCRRGEEERSHRQDTLIQLLRRREKRLSLMTRFLSVALLLVISVTLASLALLLERRAPETPDIQPMTHPEGHSSDISLKQPKQETGDMYPSAMLTAPDNYTVGTPLEWQSHLGNAHCQGGFTYSSGYLVVPRSGKYKVYLQITYESDPNKYHGHDEVEIVNTVYVSQEAYNKDVALLSSVDTGNCMTHWRKTLHTDGSFVLEANSRLWVKSSYPELIAKREDLTFFGAELQTVHVSNT